MFDLEAGSLYHYSLVQKCLLWTLAVTSVFGRPLASIGEAVRTSVGDTKGLNEKLGFLHEFGYMNHDDWVNIGQEISSSAATAEAHMSAAISAMQSFAGIPVTGILQIL